MRIARAGALKPPGNTKPKGIMVRDGRPEPGSDHGSWVDNLIKQFCVASAYGKISADGDERIFDEPLVGYSSGSDPIYGQLKDQIGPPYMTPREIFERSFPDLVASAHELTVISFVMPFARQIRLDNRMQTTYPAERWVRAKRSGNEFAGRLTEHLIGSLERAEIASVAPRFAPFYGRKGTRPTSPASEPLGSVTGSSPSAARQWTAARSLPSLQFPLPRGPTRTITPTASTTPAVHADGVSHDVRLRQYPSKATIRNAAESTVSVPPSAM